MDRVLHERLSPERLAPYVVATESLAGAVRLHEWNTRVSGALFESFQMFEVVLRNAMHSVMQDAFATNWYDNLETILDERGQKDLIKVRRRLRARARQESAGRVVAELNFGFWRYLLAKQYEHTLWIPILRHAFPRYRGSRKVVYQHVRKLNDLRNRVAHHEPIHAWNLRESYRSLLQVTDWICVDTANWINAQSRVLDVLSERP